MQRNERGITRREFMKGAAGVLVGAAAARAADSQRTSNSTQPSSKPNLLVIHTDEHSLRTLGCYRALLPEAAAKVWGPAAVLETPNIDWIAKNGVLCDRFYATSPVCTPSRASLVSGRYPQNTGAHTNNLPMLDEVVTFGEALRREGYATGYAGKWHLDSASKPGWGPARKFGFEDNRYMFNRGHWKQLEDTDSGPRVKAMDAKGTPTYAVAGADERSFTTDFLTGKTIDFIKAHAGGPFCYMVSIPDPHGPNTVRDPYDGMFQKIRFQEPANIKGAPGLPGWANPAPGERFGNEMMARYFGMVKCIDDNVGRILAALRESGVLERTIVVFTSDHGDLCGEHGRFNKGVPLETSARVPLIVYAPGRVKAGTVVREALGTVDFKPTILGLMGFRSPDPAEGRDASALLREGRAPEGWRNVTCFRHSANQWLAAASTRYKLVFSTGADPVLFDLEADPLEMKNVFGEAANREVVRELGKALLEYSQKYKEPMFEIASMAADLRWAAEGTGEYKAPARAAGAFVDRGDEEDGAGGKAGGKKKGAARKAAKAGKAGTGGKAGKGKKKS